MKKNLFVAIALCVVFLMVLSGCQAGLVDSNVTINADGSGVKTITIDVYPDDAILAGKTEGGEGNTVGNNSKYLLVTGDALANKIKSYSALSDLEVTVTTREDGHSIVTVSYEFDSIDDYNTKTKTLAKDNAELIEAATFTDNGDGTFTYKENTENTKNAIDNLFLSLYNDPEAFSKDGQGDCDLEAFGYTYTCIYTIMSESATVGDETTKVQVNIYNDSNTIVEQDWADYIEVTGTPKAEEPAPTEPAPTDPAPSDPAPAGGNTGLIIGIAAAVVVIAVVVIVIVSKKKKA